MTDRPIIFSAPMVRALFDGRKTQTRRVLKWQGPRGFPHSFDYARVDNPAGVQRLLVPCHHPEEPTDWDDCMMHRHYGPADPGDRLWVREGGELLHDADDWNGVDRWHVAGWRYADGNLKEFRDFGAPLSEWVGDCSSQQRSPIFMPRWASRLTLLVTDVRVQRLQEIGFEDCRAEGADPLWREYIHPQQCPEPRCDGVHYGEKWHFRSIWNSLHGPDAWDQNPWVAAISFTVHRCNIDQMEAG